MFLIIAMVRSISKTTIDIAVRSKVLLIISQIKNLAFLSLFSSLALRSSLIKHNSDTTKLTIIANPINSIANIVSPNL